MEQLKILQALGLVAKAKKYLYGQRLLERLTKKEVYLIITCRDMGSAVKKKVNDKANTNQIKIINDLLTVQELTKILNHSTPISTIGITDQNFAKLIESYL
jgi:ribosomal protein L7Ae-like RNA K-turn-binding protein